MPSEPNFSKRISNSTVCTWFYILAILNLVFSLSIVVSALYIKKRGIALNFLIAGFIGCVNTWFLFLVCKRALHEGFAPIPPSPPGMSAVRPPGTTEPVRAPGTTEPVRNPVKPGTTEPVGAGMTEAVRNRPLVNMCDTPFVTNLINGCNNLRMVNRQ
jgi:Na+/melibiose symporter-like transporter